MNQNQSTLKYIKIENIYIYSIYVLPVFKKNTSFFFVVFISFAISFIQNKIKRWLWKINCMCFSSSDGGCTESISRCAIRHWRHNRLSDWSVSSADKFLVFPRISNDDIVRAQVPSNYQWRQVQIAHEANDSISESKGLRKL